MDRVISMSTQSNSQPTSTPQADIKPETETGLDDRLNPIFKAIADLQEAVKDLATAVTSSAEAQEGLEETLTQKMASFEKDLGEYKKFTVGFQAAAANNKASDRFGAIGTPSKSDTAKDTVTQEGGNSEPGFPMISKADIKKSIMTPRPEVEIGTKMGERSGLQDIVKEVLEGRIKPYQAGKKAYELEFGGVM